MPFRTEKHHWGLERPDGNDQGKARRRRRIATQMLVTVDPADRDRDWLSAFPPEGTALSNSTWSAAATESTAYEPDGGDEPVESTPLETALPADALDAPVFDRRFVADRRLQIAAVFVVLAVAGLVRAGTGAWRAQHPTVPALAAPIQNARVEVLTEAQPPIEFHETVQAQPESDSVTGAVASSGTVGDARRLDSPSRSVPPRIVLTTGASPTVAPPVKPSPVSPRVGFDVPPDPIDAPRVAATASEADPATSSPSSALSTVAPEAVPAPSDTDVIRVVLARYQRAYSELNIEEAKAVWPAVDDKALGRAFGQLDSQAVVLEACQIEVASGEAVSACRGHASYVPKVGSRTVRTDSRTWTFQLRKADDGEWMIETVDSR